MFVASLYRRSDPFRERIEAAAHVLHAGDFDSESALADTRHYASKLTAVSGNMDPRIGLPAVATVELGGVEFVLTHGTGPTRGYEQRVATTVREEASTDDAVGIAGHTHELLDTRSEGTRLLILVAINSWKYSPPRGWPNFQFLIATSINPGSVTGASPATRAMMMTATVADGSLDVETHEL